MPSVSAVGKQMAGGMRIIEDKIKTLEHFQATAEEQVIRTCKLYEPEIIDMNTEQLHDGQLATMTPVTPGYRPLTVQIKRAKGQPTDRVTLKDTGDFYRSFRILVNFNVGYFSIVAEDEKADKLERKYGKDIYGLSEENRDELAAMILPDMINNLRKVI